MKNTLLLFLIYVFSGCFTYGNEESGLAYEKSFIWHYKIDKISFLDTPLEEVIFTLNTKIKKGQKEMGVEDKDLVQIKFSDHLAENNRKQNVYIGLKKTSLKVFLDAVFEQTFLSYRLEDGAIVLFKDID